MTDDEKRALSEEDLDEDRQPLADREVMSIISTGTDFPLPVDPADGEHFGLPSIRRRRTSSRRRTGV